MCPPQPAIYIVYRSYDALGMTTLRDDAKWVLEKSYPKSEFRQDFGQLKTRGGSSGKRAEHLFKFML